MKKDYKWIALAIIIQLVICLFVGIRKKSFFCDEIYSYGLANCTQYMFLDPASAEEYNSTGWVDERYFKQYVEVSSSQKLSFKAPIQNQKMDVHPPLYYCLLHMVCYLFRGSFSKWTGLGLNGMILVLTDFIILYIAYYLYRDMKKAILAMLLWSCSAAGLSNILFIRMYLLLTCIILAFAALHIRYIENRLVLGKKDYVILGLLVAVGGLTHYYFYPFVFFFSGVVCIYLFYRRRMVEMIKYGSALTGGFLLALFVFPSTIRHVVGYRGDEVHVRGDYTAVMDVDLQDPPSLLPQMLEILQTGVYDSVATRRMTRKGEPWIRSWFAKRFYQIINRISDADIVDGARDFRLMKREMVDTIVRMGEYNRFSKGIFGWIGFRTYWLAYENINRVAGETKWNFWKLFRYAVDGVINFSHLPLSVASWFGMLMTVFSFAAVVVISLRRLIWGDPVAGWASIVCIMTLIGGIQLFCMGIMGQYISKIYMEVKKRPHYIVAESNLYADSRRRKNEKDETGQKNDMENIVTK